MDLFIVVPQGSDKEYVFKGKRDFKVGDLVDCNTKLGTMRGTITRRVNANQVLKYTDATFPLKEIRKLVNDDKTFKDHISKEDLDIDNSIGKIINNMLALLTGGVN